MQQWLNRLVALLVALMLGATVFIGLQSPPPTEVRRPRLRQPPHQCPRPHPQPLRSLLHLLWTICRETGAESCWQRSRTVGYG